MEIVVVVIILYTLFVSLKPLIFGNEIIIQHIRTGYP